MSERGKNVLILSDLRKPAQQSVTVGEATTILTWGGWIPVVTRIVNLLPTATTYWITKAAGIATGNSAIHLSEFINLD